MVLVAIKREGYELDFMVSNLKAKGTKTLVVDDVLSGVILHKLI